MDPFLSIFPSVHPTARQQRRVQQNRYQIVIFFEQNAKNPLSVFGLNMRTTSSLESLNAVLGRLLPRHPNIYKFVDGIKIHEFSKYNELLQLSSMKENATKLSRKRKRDQERDDKIKKATQELTEKKISTSEFLETFSNNENLLPNSGKLFYKSVFSCEQFHSFCLFYSVWTLVFIDIRLVFIYFGIFIIQFHYRCSPPKNLDMVVTVLERNQTVGMFSILGNTRWNSESCISFQTVFSHTQAESGKQRKFLHPRSKKAKNNEMKNSVLKIWLLDKSK